MATPRACVDCGKTRPPMTGDTTLVTTLGWRLIKVSDTPLVMQWRCPPCWRKHKHPDG